MSSRPASARGGATLLLAVALAGCSGSQGARLSTAGLGPAPVTPPLAPAPSPSYGPVVPPVPPVPVGEGSLSTVPGGSPRAGTGPLRRYTVAVERGMGIDGPAFARTVDEVLGDPRSWGAGSQASFQRVDAGPAEFRVVLASPAMTDRLCAPLHTAGAVSCSRDGNAVVNVKRWLRGAAPYAGRLSEYRAYVINHEVGHVLGHGHERCPRAGELAPVMLQQTLGVGDCRPNPWPYPP